MTEKVSEIIGVYDADSSLLGEITYWVKARFGAAHCALCDLTHGTFKMKSEWSECATNLSIPIVTFHRDDAPSDVLRAVDELPAVLARTEDGPRLLFSRADLEQFKGDTARFITAVVDYVRNETAKE